MAFGEEFLQAEQPAQPAENNPTPQGEQQPTNTEPPAGSEPPVEPAQPTNDIPPAQPATEPSDPPAQPAALEGLNPAQILEYFAANGRTVDNVEDLFKEKEVVKEVNPYEGVLDEEDKQYLNFKKETGRGRKEFEFLNQDIDALNPIDLAKEQIKRDTGLSLTTEKAIEYLEDKFDIDLGEAELSIKAQIELNKFVKPVKDEYSSLKEQYKKPIEKLQPLPQEDIVQLTDGTMMKKADYDKLVINHQKHIEASKASVNSVTEASFKMVIDDNGTNREVSYGYDYSQEDKQNMVSVVSNVDATMEKRYRSEQGFNHKQFAEDMFWSDPANREKAIPSMLAKARAEAIAEVMQLQNNTNFERNPMPSKAAPGGQNIFPIGPTNNGFGFGEQFK